MASHDAASVICQVLIDGGIIRAPAPVPAAVGLVTGTVLHNGGGGGVESLRGKSFGGGGGGGGGGDDGGVGGSRDFASGIGSPYTRASRSLGSGSGAPLTTPVSPVTAPRQSVDGGSGRACLLLPATSTSTRIPNPRVVEFNSI